MKPQMNTDEHRSRAREICVHPCLSGVPTWARSGRALVGVVAFLAGFVAILLLVVHLYLLPAAQAAHGADAAARHQLAAISSLVLTIVLFCLLAILIICFRPGRLILPRKPTPRTRTPYVDAWAESARRMEQPPRDDSEDQPKPGNPDDT